uniref:O-methyltransferase n=1 Tax=Falsiroseomonas sp. TaxID=2870721 RepID=UPI0034A5D2AD
MTDLPTHQDPRPPGSMRECRLSDLFLAHRGNVSDKWEQYLAIYEAELAPFLAAGQPVRLLEIGVQNGGSLQIWRSYLPPGSSIVGIDIDPACAKLALGDDISVLIGDASDPEELDRLLGDAVFDIIVDDGSHRSEHIIAAFEACWRRVAPGGLFIAEDLHCSYFESHGGGFRKPDAAIEHFKALADAVNADHFEGDAAQNTDPAELDRLRAMGRQIARVSFYDSMIFVQHAVVTREAPYRRVLTGLAAPVADLASMVPRLPTPQLRSLLLSSTAAQAFEPALRGSFIAARETIALQNEAIVAQRETIGALRSTIEEQRGTVTALRDSEAAALAEAATLRDTVEEQRGTITALRD